MQIQLDDIAGGKRLLWQGGEEEFVDNARTRDAHWALLLASGMRCHDHAAPYALRPHRHVWTVVEAADDLACLRAVGTDRGADANAPGQEDDRAPCTLCLVSRKRNPRDRRARPRTILAIEPQQSALFRELVRRKVATNGHESLAQFRSVASVASIPKRAEPLVAVGLADDGARPYDLPPLASCVPRGTDLIQPIDWAGGRSSVWGKAAYAGRLTGAIKIKDHPGVSRSIRQPTNLLLGGVAGEWATEQIIEKERAQGFNRCLGQRCEISARGSSGLEVGHVQTTP